MVLKTNINDFPGYQIQVLGRTIASLSTLEKYFVVKKLTKTKIWEGGKNYKSKMGQKDAQ
jgi:hypothetical protein